MQETYTTTAGVATIAYLEKLFRRTKKSNDCWVWQGYKTPKGYSQIKHQGRRSKLHRFMYEVTRGPMPKHLLSDHLCRNRGCINPKHIEAVTPRENVMRGQNFTAINARKTHCLRGHPYSGNNLIIVYTTPGNPRRCRECARIWRRNYWLRKTT